MKLSIFIVFLILLSPCIVSAAEEGKLTVIPAINPVANLTSPINHTSMDFVTEQTIVNKSSVETMENEAKTIRGGGLPSTSKENDKDGSTLGKLMIKGGLEEFFIDNINDVFTGVGGLQAGKLNDTEDKDSSQIAIFAVAAHTIDPTRDPDMMAQIETMRDIYVYAILLFGAILALFLLYQIVEPDDSAKVLEDFTGTYGYVAIQDMGKYYINTCGWLLLGPALFFGTIKLNNILVEGQMLSILDQVAFSSDSIGLYLTMCVLWFVSTLFFAARLAMIIIGAYVWIMYGLGFAFKKVRWAAIIATSYQIVFILSQFAVVWVCCIIVSYTASKELAWYSVSFIYLGLFLIVCSMEFIFVTWPILWKLLSPQTLSTAIRLARYV